MTENIDLLENSTEDTAQRPPRPPGPTMGPYFQFLTTDLKKRLWIGSALILRAVSSPRPSIKLDSAVKVNYEWEVLYENLFGMKAYRVNIDIELQEGTGDERIGWEIDWGDYTTKGSFYIARYAQKWRGAFFSCNGFDATVSREVAAGLTYNTVWNHLLSVHDENPFHLLVWGGDQNYNDFVLEDVPFLQKWSRMEWKERWECIIPENDAQEIEQYYFYNYAEHWERRSEMKKALGSVPSVMMWDDHDIFDGAGSYPTMMCQSPVMSGLFDMAQKMRLLFQHHTTPTKARQHRLFGYQGYNFLAQCGPNLVLLGTDGRTERDHKTVTHENTWDMIFNKLDTDLENVQHLIVLVAVPFSFSRFKMAESILETWKKYSMRRRDTPFSEITNSIFGLPEMYDDLLDEWTHEAHLEERNRVLGRLQQVADKKRVRITYFSGDVHCCGVARFRTRRHRPRALVDPKLMYQIISSAIVNRPPPNIFIRGAHFFSSRWHPNDDTEEMLIKFFDHAPEYNAKLMLRKLLPNRNWCLFEQCEPMVSIPADALVRSSCLDDYFWPIIDFLLLLIHLGRFVRWKNRRSKQTNIRRKKTKSSRIDSTKQTQDLINHLKIRFWLENTEKENDTEPFSNYDLYIPDLKSDPLIEV